MDYQGSGSKDSPIAIEDSEDEVLQELEAKSSNSTNPSQSLQKKYPKLSLEERMMPTDSAIYEKPEEGLREATVATHNGKRKRAESDAWKDIITISSSPFRPPDVLQAPFQVAPMSKKARKRQRKMEKQGMEAQHSLHQPPASNSSYTSSPTWSEQLSVVPDYSQVASTSTSVWVSSMAHAGRIPAQFAHPEQVSPHMARDQLPPVAPNLPPRPPVPVPSQIPAPQAQALPIPAPSAKLPAKPNPPITGPLPRIGMDPEPDPSSKHGLFELPSHNGVLPYQPNPARTLVMEQLPKQSRNRDFLNRWSRQICGANPAHVLLDAPSAKALLEFSTAEHARKCWASPRLGHELVGLPTHQLKGKARVDLIKVWWYRLPGTGADTGVGEIEEGEIEGDDEDVQGIKTTEIKAKKDKETKKERKARLARERAQKEQQTIGSRVPTSAFPSTSLSARQIPQSSLIFPMQIEPQSSSPTAGIQPTSHVGSSGRTLHPLPVRPQGREIPRPSGHNSSTAQPMALQTSSPPPVSNQLASSAAAMPVEEDMDIEDMMLESPQLEPSLGQDVAGDSSTTVSHPFSLPARPTAVVAPQPRLPRPPNNYTIPPSTASTPASIDVASKSGSPLPSEPRAMKNLPKAPSFTKRALMAKQKELEQRIAQSKQQLGLPVPTPSMSSTSNSAEGSPVPTPPMTPSLSAAPGDSTHPTHSQAMEDRLRSLVLKSRLTKLKVVANGQPAPVETAKPMIPSPSPALASPTIHEATPETLKPSNKLNLNASVSGPALSVDDLAASFIAETIQTVQVATLPFKPQPALVANTDRDSKAQLAARQRQLEQHIAESKVLMEQLTKAETKQERDRVLGIMRQRSRFLEGEAATNGKEPTLSPTNNHFDLAVGKTSILNYQTSTTQLMPAVAVKWPESRHDAGILIVSDDEESDDEY